MCGGVGLGEQEDNGLRFGNWWSHWMGSTWVVWWGFLGGIHFTCLLAGGIPKLGDLGVEGHPSSAQVNARVLQQGFLTLGLYDRKV